jgi:hypothetical protein
MPTVLSGAVRTVALRLKRLKPVPGLKGLGGPAARRLDREPDAWLVMPPPNSMLWLGLKSWLLGSSGATAKAVTTDSLG